MFKICMRNLVSLPLLIILILLSVTNSTIDINMQEYSYIADHLTSEECRRLVASLHFVSYEPPAALTTAEKMIPEDIPCFKLLINWDGGKNKWEGRGKSHVVVANRLRQISRPDLAAWLEDAVFLELTKELNFTLLYPSFIENIERGIDDIKKYKDKGLNDDKWTTLDSYLWVFITGLCVMVLTTFCRILYLTCKKDRLKKDVDPEQMADLLSLQSVDSEEETIYEFVENKKSSECNKNNG